MARTAGNELDSDLPWTLGEDPHRDELVAANVVGQELPIFIRLPKHSSDMLNTDGSSGRRDVL
jgi:hypothetical protein